MLSRSLLLFILPSVFGAGATNVCKTDLDCSLNGECSEKSGECTCNTPWRGPRCGVLGYREKQTTLGKNLYPLNATGATRPCVAKNGSCPALNTWNGPIAFVNGKYHMFNPLYARGSLLQTQDMMHGVADNVTGPYAWSSMGRNMGSNPAFVAYLDAETNRTMYSLWAGGKVYVSDDIFGDFEHEIAGASPGSNPAPIFRDGVWYATTQSTREIVTTSRLGERWMHFADIDVRMDHGTREDPFMWIDRAGRWHIINHAYDTSEYSNCGSSLVSAHLFSENGTVWHTLGIEPYAHRVTYADGTEHVYTTLERPNAVFDASGVMTHIGLAADLQTQDEGCVEYDVCPAKQDGRCACTNCKYADHCGSVLIELDSA